MQEDKQNKDKLFSELVIEESIQAAIADCGYIHPTPIQQKTLPLTLTGHDVMGIAQTGTGKTAAFLISLLHYLLVNPVHPKAKGPWAIVLAPTRELAIQIKKELDVLGRYSGLNSLAIYGGTSIEQQKALFESATIDIIVGTPGRIIDLFKQRVFRLKNIEVCVLDEADRMFDLGFIDDVRFLLRQMPDAEERLNLLFSATMSQKVQELAYEYFNAPKIVTIEAEQTTAENVEQSLYHTAKQEKIPLLLGLLAKEKPERTMIFVNTKKDLEYLSAVLHANSYPNAALSGDLPQRRREQIIRQFHDGTLNLVVATDVAARGIHIPDITHVINYDLPQIAEDYVHRIGRTARAGASGKALSFACEEYVYSLPEIENYIGQKIPVEPVTDALLCQEFVQPNPQDLAKTHRTYGKRPQSHNRRTHKHPSRNTKKS